MTPTPFARMKDVTFSYRSWDITVRAIEMASVEFPAAGWVLVTGANGAGKSTLLRLLAGTLAPDFGEISVGGKNPARMSASERAEAVSFVRQRPEQALVVGLTVQEHVTVAGMGWDQFIEKLDALDPLAQFAFLAPMAHRPVETLSGGQRRTLGLALQFTRAAGLLLLDEPFTGLDEQRLRAFEAVVQRLALQRCVVHVSHEPGTVRSMATEEVHLSHGRVEVRQLGGFR